MFLFPSINSISSEIIQQQDHMKIVQGVVVLLLGLLVCVETSENQKVVSDIVNAITKSGINSGINEAQLRRVLNSDSMNTNKATINVINLVPKKKAAGTTISGLPSPLLTQNMEVGNRISETTNLPKLVLSESYIKQQLPVSTGSIENKCFTAQNKPIQILNSPIVQNPYVVINEPIRQAVPLVNTQPTNLQNPFQQTQPTETITQQNIQIQESSQNPFELQKNLNHDSGNSGSKSINISFQTGPFVSPTLPGSKGKVLGTGNKTNSKSLNINISGNKTDKDKTPFSLKQFLSLSKKSKTPNNNPTSSKQKNCPKPSSPQPCCCCCEDSNPQIETEDISRRYNRFSSQQP